MSEGLGTKEVLLSFEGCYSSPTSALKKSFLKSKDPGVLTTVTTEKDFRSREICVDLSRNKHKQGKKSELNQMLPGEKGDT